MAVPVKGLPKSFAFYTVEGRPGFYRRVRGGTRPASSIKAKVTCWKRSRNGKGAGRRPARIRVVPAEEINAALERATAVPMPDPDERLVCGMCLHPTSVGVLTGRLLACRRCHQAEPLGEGHQPLG